VATLKFILNSQKLSGDFLVTDGINDIILDIISLNAMAVSGCLMNVRLS